MPAETKLFIANPAILKPDPDPFKGMGKSNESSILLSNGESKRYAAVAAGVPVHKPDREVLSLLADIEYYHESQYGNKGVVKLYELHNGKKLNVPYPVYVANLKAKGLAEHIKQSLDGTNSYWESNDFLPGHVPQKFMVTDNTAYVGDFACNKPESPEEIEALIELWKRGQAQGLSTGYLAGITELDYEDINDPKIKLYSVQTKLGRVRRNIDWGQVEQLLKNHPNSTGGMHYDSMLNELINNPKGIAQTTVTQYYIQGDSTQELFVGGRIQSNERFFQIPIENNSHTLFSVVRGFARQK